MENKYILILLFSAIIYLFYKNNKLKEKMTNTSVDIETIKKAVNEVYQADINAIRNLSIISRKLQSGGKNGLLTIPGNVRIEGTLDVVKNSNLKGNLNVSKNSNLNEINCNGNLNVNKNSNLNELNCKGNLNVNKNIYGQKNIVATNTVQGKSLFSKKNQSWIGYYGDGKNYLRGNSQIRGNSQPRTFRF